MSPAAMVIDPAAEATVCAMFASRGVNGRSGLSAAKTPMLIAAESTLPPCAHPAFSPKLTFIALTMNPTTTPVTTARALRGSASRDDIATTRGRPEGARRPVRAPGKTRAEKTRAALDKTDDEVFSTARRTRSTVSARRRPRGKIVVVNSRPRVR